MTTKDLYLEQAEFLRASLARCQNAMNKGQLVKTRGHGTEAQTIVNEYIDAYTTLLSSYLDLLDRLEEQQHPIK